MHSSLFQLYFFIFSIWNNTSLSERIQLVEEFQASRADISWLITSETGKAVNHLDQQKEQAAQNSAL
jgi:hypothetical protein